MNEELFTLGPISPSRFVGRGYEVGLVKNGSRDASGGRLWNVLGPLKIGRSSFLRYLVHDINRGYNTSARARSGRKREGELLLASYFDAERAMRSPQPAETLLTDVLLRDLEAAKAQRPLPMPWRAVSPVPRPDDEDDAAVEAVRRDMLQLQTERQARFLLLVDNAEWLLEVDTAPAAQGETTVLQRVTDVLATLNEYVQGFGLVLSFGPQGPLRHADARQRAAIVEEAVRATSDFLGLIADDLVLGLLADADIYDFLAPLELDDGDRRWVAELAGGHPYLANALAAAIDKEREPGRIGPLSEPLRRQIMHRATRDARRLLEQILGRFAPSHAVTRALATLANADDNVALMGDEFAAAEILVAEGVLRCSPRGFGIRSTLLKEAARLIPALSSGSPAPVSVRSTSNPESVVDVSLLEAQLLECLLQAPADGLVAKSELVAALSAADDGPVGAVGEDDVRRRELRMNQRLSALRRKLRQVTNDVDPIENVYGRGYRLKERDQFEVVATA